MCPRSPRYDGARRYRVRGLRDRRSTGSAAAELVFDDGRSLRVSHHPDKERGTRSLAPSRHGFCPVDEREPVGAPDPAHFRRAPGERHDWIAWEAITAVDADADALRVGLSGASGGFTLPRIHGSFALAQRLFFDRYARRASDPAADAPLPSAPEAS